jgi:cytidylate kinase
MSSQPSPRSLTAIVDEQIHRWRIEQARRARERSTRERAKPIVTVSRQAGSRGTDLARLVSESLGFSFWDQELVNRIAEQIGAPEAMLRAVDEHPRGRLADLLSGILMGDRSTEEEYFAQLVRLVGSLAERGGAVIVGRGAQFVVGAESALRVRVVAPLDARVHTLAAQRGIRDAEARAEVERLDRERGAFMRHHYDRDVTDPAAYDLLINSATLPMESAVRVVVAAYRTKFPEAAAEAEAERSAAE